MINKKDLSEQDIRTKFITPAISDAKWDTMSQMREEVYFTNGRVIVQGKTVNLLNSATGETIATIQIL